MEAQILFSEGSPSPTKSFSTSTISATPFRHRHIRALQNNVAKLKFTVAAMNVQKQQRRKTTAEYFNYGSECLQTMNSRVQHTSACQLIEVSRFAASLVAISNSLQLSKVVFLFHVRSEYL